MTDEAYFGELEDRLDDAIEHAERARKRGADPKPEVEIPVAKDLADRVENLIGVEGVAERIRALEETEDSREDVALRLAEEFAEGKFPPETRDDKAEAAIRTAVALLTEGVVAAPIEGIDGVDLLENDDGTEYLRVEYAGPIRSAGGTAQALSVLIADYVGSSLGVDAYKPRDDEVERYIEEINLYAEETGLQYTPKDKETRLIIDNCPICLDGEPTTEREVSGYRDLERIDTNRGRGGMCLVAAEGIALKAPKIKKYVDALDMDGWDWIEKLMHDTSSSDSSDGEEDIEEEDDEEEEEGVKPNPKFLEDLTAGRPIFSHPSRPGGFRLRYARARNTGLAAAGVSPATMVIFDDFLAAGTQIKTERPGKAEGVAPVDGIEGPTVVLSNGEVRRIDTEEEARRVRNGVERIVDIGEIALNYGEFLENNHPLVPGAYTHGWWVQELKESEADVEGLRHAFDLEDLPAKGAFRLSRKYGVPLHPRYTYLWHDIDRDEYNVLCDAVVRHGDGELVFNAEAAPILEKLLVPHVQEDEEARVEDYHAYALGECLDVSAAGDSALEAASEAAGVKIRERAPTRVGARMGRPEKSKKREMSPAVHCLFPIGDAGGSQRDIDEAASHAETMRDTVGKINVGAGGRRCPSCGEETYENVCGCGTRTEPVRRCPSCEIEVDEGVEECPRCGGETTTVRRFDVRIDERYREALDNVGERATYDILKCVKGLTSERKTPEPLEKGVLRAKHDVSTFKDGTVRYDMTDLPLTAFRPDEIGVSVERLREMGYGEDIDGEPLTDETQVVELKPQDVVLSHDSAEHLKRVADFVDDLLVQYYGVEPYHELDVKDDLVGELVMGLAPHTSAGVLGRVVGFTGASVGYAHPFFHAAKRRNCFHPETEMPFFDEEGCLRHETVEEFVEERFEGASKDDIRRDDFGTVVAGTEGVEVPSLDDGGKMTVKPVKAVSRHTAPEHLVKLGTRGGREIVVTPDHEMQVPNESECVTAKRASEISIGDSLLTPRKLGTVTDGGVCATYADTSSKENVVDAHPDTVESVEYVRSDVEHVYCLTVEDTHSLVVNDLASKQCDGDEDCVTLLSDALLNFSHEYLPDQRGGSVAEDSRLVAFGPDGETRFVTFDELWDELDSPVEHDGKFEKKTCLSEGWRTYAFDDNHRSSPMPIEKAIRYRAGDEKVLRVETQFGRELEVTANHSLFRYDDGIEEVECGDLREGDLVVAPRELDIEPDSTGEDTIDVADCLDEPYVFVEGGVKEYLEEVWNGSDHGSGTRAAFDGGLSYRLSKKKVWLRTLERIDDEASLSSLSQDEQMVGLKGSSTGVRRRIEIDDDFAWLLGVFVAEGTLSSTRPALHNSDEEVVDEVVERAERVLGVEPSVRWSNRAYEVGFPTVFREVLYDLGLGSANHGSYHPSEKSVPKPVLSGDTDVVKSFLRGFLAGDGSETTDDNHTTLAFHTTSEDVKDGIVFLLHRLGIVSNVSERERDEPRHDIYTVTVSGGASDNPLRRVLNDDDTYLPKSLVVSVPDELMRLREMNDSIEGVNTKQAIPKYLKRRDKVSLEKLGEMVEEIEDRAVDLPDEAVDCLDSLRTIVDGDLAYLRVKSIEEVDYDDDAYLYDLQVGGEPVFTANWLYAHNSMDAPLVMTSRIDPTEIDDEAHNVDKVSRYPASFHEAAREGAHPKEVDVRIAEDDLETPRAFDGFGHTVETTSIDAGPENSAYKILPSMNEKTMAQLEIGRKTRAVDESDVAERVVESHFLPDLIGNLRAFTQQEFRCLDCNKKFRRPPLSGDCDCGGRVTLTVHKGSVKKYLDVALETGEKYGVSDYTMQRLEQLERQIDSLFEDDKSRQSGIVDFM